MFIIIVVIVQIIMDLITTTSVVLINTMTNLVYAFLASTFSCDKDSIGVSKDCQEREALLKYCITNEDRGFCGTANEEPREVPREVPS